MLENSAKKNNRLVFVMMMQCVFATVKIKLVKEYLKKPWTRMDSLDK
jgi:hypothetical protein